MTGLRMNRRAVLGGAAAAPVLAATGGVAIAQTAALAQASQTRQFKLGDMVVTTLLDGQVARDGVKEIFGGGATEEEFAQLSAENFISATQAQFYFTPVLVQTGGQTVLFDTGLGRGGVIAALTEVGVTPDQIDLVVLTHMHPDHIGGLMGPDGPAFPNAAYVTAAAEYDFWSQMAPGNRVGDLVAKNVVPLAEKMTFVGDGAQVAPGITAMASFGHTPGHLTHMLESNGQALVLTADLANHYVWSFARPDWEVRFDMDKAAAAAARRQVMGMLAADRVPMIGYHMPFPAAGFVEPRGDGFRFVPVSYQML